MAGNATNALKQRMSAVHGVLYERLNSNSRLFFQKNGKKIPIWVTANAITSGRLTLVLPTTLLISHGYTWLPAGLVLANAAFDYVDGAVARWEHEDKDRALALSIKRNEYLNKGIAWNARSSALNQKWGAYYDALADKLFALPVWCAICVVNPEVPWIQFGALAHLSVESFSAYVRTKSYFMNPTASSDVVTAKSTGKIKQAVSMLGTAMILVPPLQTVGGILLWASLPLSVASVTEKLQEKALERALVYSKDIFSADTLLRVAEMRKKYEIIVCLEKERDKELQVVKTLGDIFNGATAIETEKLVEADFDSLGANLVFVASESDVENVDSRLRDRGVVKIL